MNLSYQILDASDLSQLTAVAEGVFDETVSTDWSLEFLSDPRHHIAVALDGDIIVGFASAVHYIHPDKQPELWINEVGVAPSHRNRRIGHEVVCTMLKHGRSLGCAQAWVLTDRKNPAAMNLYAGLPGSGSPSDQTMFEFDLSASDPEASPGPERKNE